MIYLTIFLIVLISGSLLWRTLCRFYTIPWPHFLAFWLENPYMKIFANPNKFIELCGPRPTDKILEIGFNAGHSALIMLLSNPNAKIVAFDIGSHTNFNCNSQMFKIGLNDAELL